MESTLPRSAPTAPPVRAALGGALALLGLAFGMGEGLSHLVRTWSVTPTYAHGFLVPLVAAWLIGTNWRGGPPRGWPLALTGAACGALLHALGSLADAQIAQHAGIALFAAGAAASVLGRRAAIRHRFALLFLVFMVPFGESLVPALQALTAQGIMGLTALFGVLAWREGTLITTPAGLFEVAEACAGLRFVIASLATGTLCAHLFFTSVWKQAAMILTSLTVPILANLLRAGGIVLVASATDMKVAAGADHLIYGWGFFAVVTLGLVLGALRLAEPDAPRLPAPPDRAGGDPLLCGAAAGGLALLAGLA